MSYNRHHIIRFLEQSKTSPAKDQEILVRMNVAINDSGDNLSGEFSASKLDEVLGDPVLVSEFNSIWDTGQLVD